VLWRNLDAHVNLIRHDMALDDTALFLTRQLMENRAEFTMNLPKQLVSASLGDKDDVVLAIPARMSRRRTDIDRL